MGAQSQKKFDFTLLEILIKLRSKNLSQKVTYSDFCAWLGSAVEPPESFYFRHDSMKNPQYEMNLEMNRNKREPNQNAVKQRLTADASLVKERFMSKMF
jgi:hypothetical protein